jgi:hypothetical protein
VGNVALTRLQGKAGIIISSTFRGKKNISYMQELTSMGWRGPYRGDRILDFVKQTGKTGRFPMEA